MKSPLRFIDGPNQCMYLPDRDATLEYELFSRLTPEDYERRMEQGWRKFGRVLFHPVCDGCVECRPIRVPVDQFVPDRSQRRALKRNSDLAVRTTRPTVDRERLDLWNRYHAAQSRRKGWPFEPASAWHYSFTYVKNPIPSLELAAYDGNELVAVALVDITPNAVSGIYHYHDPARADRSLGKFVMLKCLELAQELGKPYFYLGYFVAGCQSMSYKAGFRPYELLQNGRWLPSAP